MRLVARMVVLTLVAQMLLVLVLSVLVDLVHKPVLLVAMVRHLHRFCCFKGLG